MRRLTLLWLGLGLVPGCTFPSPAHVPYEQGRYQARANSDEPPGDRMDPDRRLRGIDERYRDVAYNFGGDRRGRFSLLYPRTGDISLAWEYCRLGADFEGRHDDAAAARAYWAALGRAGSAVASRPSRERVRRVAFLGLTRIATRRHQPIYSDLLGLCAALGELYLGSQEAEGHHEQFVEAYGKIWQAAEKADYAREQAEAAQRQAMINAALQIGMAVAQNTANAMVAQQQAAAAGGSAPDASAVESAVQDRLQMMTDVQQMGEQLSQQEQAMNEAYAEASGAIASSAMQFKQVLAGDLPAIAAGQSFVANEVLFTLASAANPHPALERIGQSLSKYPKVHGAVERLQALMEPEIGSSLTCQAAGSNKRFPAKLLSREGPVYSLRFEDGFETRLHKSNCDLPSLESPGRLAALRDLASEIQKLEVLATVKERRMRLASVALPPVRPAPPTARPPQPPAPPAPPPAATTTSAPPTPTPPPPVPGAELFIDTEPTGATVTIDGKPSGKTPVSGKTKPGRHRVRVELEGYQGQEREAEATDAQPAHLMFVLEPVAPTPPPAEQGRETP